MSSTATPDDLEALRVKLERSAVLDAAGLCCVCELPKVDHCQECWVCPDGPPFHEDMCGF